MNEVIRVLLTCLAAIFAGVILGNGAVYFFNRIPGGWLCDYGQEPDEELLHPTIQRLRSVPWKYVFSGLFVVMAVWLAMRNPVYGVAALAAVWLLLEMAIADIKYRIVPDQLVLLLVICGCGFIPFHEGGPLSGLWGALVGFGVMLLIGILGKLCTGAMLRPGRDYCRVYSDHSAQCGPSGVSSFAAQGEIHGSAAHGAIYCTGCRNLSGTFARNTV